MIFIGPVIIFFVAHAQGLSIPESLGLSLIVFVAWFVYGTIRARTKRR